MIVGVCDFDATVLAQFKSVENHWFGGLEVNICPELGMTTSNTTKLSGTDDIPSTDDTNNIEGNTYTWDSFRGKNVAAVQNLSNAEDSGM